MWGSTKTSSRPTAIATTSSSLISLAGALFVEGLLATAAGLTLTTITNEWSYVAFCATAAIALSLAGWTVLGYAKLLITWKEENE